MINSTLDYLLLTFTVVWISYLWDTQSALHAPMPKGFEGKEYFFFCCCLYHIKYLQIVPFLALIFFMQADIFLPRVTDA